MAASQPSAGASSSSSSAQPFTSLLLHTQNITRSLQPRPSPLASSSASSPTTAAPSAYKGELASALHETFHFALDGDPRDWEVPTSSRDSQGNQTYGVRPGFFPRAAAVPGASAQGKTDGPGDEDEEQDDYISFAYHAPTKSLCIPHPVAVTNPIQDPCCGPIDVLPNGGRRRDSGQAASSQSEQGAAMAVKAAAANPNSEEDTTSVRDAFDVTAKFFLLSSRSGASSEQGDRVDETLDYVHEATKRLTMVTGAITVDTFILSLPQLQLGHGVSAREDGEDEGGQQPDPSDVDFVGKVWESISLNPQFVSLGLSDVSLPAVRTLFDSAEEKRGAGGARRNLPRLITVDTQRMRTPCGWDRGLMSWCEGKGVMLAAGNDGDDILPAPALQALLTEFGNALPHPIEAGKRLEARWALKYTVLIRDRGVLAGKGFIVYCEAV